ncbi:MAG: 30S ribosomal protein S16 [Candidatus Nealsonbacteria bacterium]|nr:30S ribosomal protein S16 [Candidatus Nealsonbacteria bacterium]
MLSIRLKRIGKKNQPSFKVIVTEKKKSSKGGTRIEELGFFNPLTKKISLKKERILYWLSKGAKCSDTIHNLLIKQKILEGKKIAVHKKSKKKEEVKPSVPGEKPAVPAAPEKTPEKIAEQKPVEQPKPSEEKKETVSPEPPPEKEKPLEEKK